MRTILSVMFVFCALSVSAMRFVDTSDKDDMFVFLYWVILEEFGEDALNQVVIKNSTDTRGLSVMAITYNFESNQISVRFYAADGFFVDENRQRQYIEAISSVNAIFFYEPLRSNFWESVKPVKEYTVLFPIGANQKYTSVYIKENYSKVLEKLKDKSVD